MKTFQSILFLSVALFMCSPRSHAAIIVELDPGPVGSTTVDTPFVWTFDELNGQLFDGSTVMVDFVFTEARSIRIDFDQTPLEAVSVVSIRLFHDGASFSNFGKAGDVLTINGAPGYSDISVPGFDIGDNAGVDNHSWGHTNDDPGIDLTYELTGFTFVAELEDAAPVRVTGGELFFVLTDIEQQAVATATVVPEPTSLAALLLLLAHRRR